MKARGMAGAVIDAAVRDLPQIKKIQFPVFSIGVAPSTSVNHYRFAGVNVPIVPGVAAIRTSLSYSSDSGYIDRYARIVGQPGPLLDSGVNQEANLMLRTTGKLLLGDDTTITPGVFFQRNKADDEAEESDFESGNVAQKKTFLAQSETGLHR